jgi:hypothetical protein
VPERAPMRTNASPEATRASGRRLASATA